MGSNHNINLKGYLEKLSEGKLNDSKKDQLQSHISTTFKNKEVDEMMAKHWEATKNSPIASTDLYFRQLRESTWSRILLNRQNGRGQAGWKTALTKVAAVLFIPLFIGSAILFYQLYQQTNYSDNLAMQKVFASPGSRVHFTLPDKSEVWLNSGSSLEYPINLSSLRERKVKLTGQGYFNVSHDKSHPFFVETGELNIKVLGTSFDVSSYSNDPQMSSTLEQGSIALLNPQGNEVARLLPGQKAMLDKTTRELRIENVDTQLTTSWKDGRLVFKNTPLTEVTRQLERWFNCHITVAPHLLNSDILYTATIQDETLGEVLKMIEISTSAKTKINNREVRIWNEN